MGITTRLLDQILLKIHVRIARHFWCLSKHFLRKLQVCPNVVKYHLSSGQSQNHPCSHACQLHRCHFHHCQALDRRTLKEVHCVCRHIFMFRHPEPSVDLLCCLCWVYIFPAWCLGWDLKFNCIHSCALFFIFSNSVMKHPKIIVQDGQNLLTLQR